MALEHLWTSLPFSLPVPQSKAFCTPAASQQLSLLSLCPQTWPKGTCSWDTWAGTSEQTPRPSPHPTQRVHPPWPCVTAAAPSAASPQRQVLGRRSRERHPSCCPIAIITLPFPGCSPHLPPLQDVSKRLSLPMDIRLPPEFLQKLQMESPEFPKPLSRMSRRASLVSHSTASCFVHTRCMC